MFEKFYERYAPEEKEVIVLIQRTLGAGYDNRGFWDMTVISLGMVFCDTGEVNIREGRLDWLKVSFYVLHYNNVTVLFVSNFSLLMFISTLHVGFTLFNYIIYRTFLDLYCYFNITKNNMILNYENSNGHSR